MNLEKNVVFIGYLDRSRELPGCYAAADAFVFASRTETQGLVLLEAMALGVPVISLVVMGTCDIVNARRGALLPRDDENEFASSIVKLAGDHELRNHLARESKDYAREWQSGVIAGKHVNLYEPVLERRSSGHAGAGPALSDNETNRGREEASFAGGCFWCLEAVYGRLQGVESVESGYMGGSIANPTYEQVCQGDTGHAEVVRVEFDPSAISYRELLNVFFSIHDPTTLNRQGSDVGTQYRSAVFYRSPEQKSDAEAVIDELTTQKVFAKPIVTEVVPASTFYIAEGYHQRYFENNPLQPYCQFVVSPKIAKFRQQWADRLK
jgi:peptide-methionine (S)-S-oxide reductase